MGTCLDRGIKVVSNAGGLDPAACAEAVAQIGQRLGLVPDDRVRERRRSPPPPRGAAHRWSPDRTSNPVTRSRACRAFITANAYLGLLRHRRSALHGGADIVITGRVTDAALVCGPAAWHHGWRRDNFDALAGAVVAGHVIECGAQVTGGNYSFFREVPGMEHVGFPWVEVFEDGSCVVGKHDGTGGEVSIGTVTSQLLYEIASPAYYGPDVTARFDSIALEQVEKDRVRISGVRGEAPPSDAQGRDERDRRLSKGPRRRAHRARH